MKRKILSLAIAASLVGALSFTKVSASDTHIYIQNYAGYNYVNVEPQGSVYYIYTPEHLNWVSYMVSQGYNFYGYEIRLMNDIDFYGASFTPIGSYYTNFNGTFNGNNHKIKNMNINFSNYWGIGFIGFLGCNGIVKDLIIDSSCSIIGYGNVGGIVVCNCGGEIKHCCSFADVYAVSEFAGGIVGYNGPNSKVYKCATWLFSNISSGCGRKVGRFVGDNYSIAPQKCEVFFAYPW